MKILVLGGTGMLGSQLLKESFKRNINIYTTVRDPEKAMYLKVFLDINKIHILNDVKENDKIIDLIEKIRPHYVINSVGIVKQLKIAEDHVESIYVNALFPHILQKLSEKFEFKLIQISTDCVFDGSMGNYKESDEMSAVDLYGRSKFLGEVGYGTGVTLRTSIIGHEIIRPGHGLLDWFLNQNEDIEGFSNAIFSGVTTNELSKIIFDYVINKNIKPGIYHVASNPISKFDLLNLVKDVYKKHIKINKNDSLKINRSLNSNLFNSISGYLPVSWEKMLIEMRNENNV